jgi:hypothetical protein
MLAGTAAAEYTELDPVPITRNLEKLPVTVVVTPAIEIETLKDEIQLRAKVEADFSDAQKKMLQIIEQFDLPKENCASYGRNVVVSKINSAALNSEGNVASVHVNAHIRVWECQKGAPQVVVKWKTKCILKNPVNGKCITKTKVPQSVSIPGQSMIKTVLVEDNIRARLDFDLKLTDGKTLALDPARVSISPSGTMEKFVVAIARFFDLNAEKMARQKLDDLVDDGTLRQSLPQEWAKYSPTIHEATFFTKPGGALGLRARFEAKLTGKDITTFIKESTAE